MVCTYVWNTSSILSNGSVGTADAVVLHQDVRLGAVPAQHMPRLVVHSHPLYQRIILEHIQSQ